LKDKLETENKKWLKMENRRYSPGRIYRKENVSENFVDLHRTVTKRGTRYSLFREKGVLNSLYSLVRKIRGKGELLHLFMPTENGGYWYYGTKTREEVDRLSALRKYPGKILSTLVQNPELVLILLAAVFPTILNIPVIKILMAKRFGL
jgi:hypothetical protein